MKGIVRRYNSTAMIAQCYRTRVVFVFVQYGMTLPIHSLFDHTRIFVYVYIDILTCEYIYTEKFWLEVVCDDFSCDFF